LKTSARAPDLLSETEGSELSTLAAQIRSGDGPRAEGQVADIRLDATLESANSIRRGVDDDVIDN